MPAATQTINVDVVGRDPMTQAYVDVADVAEHYGVAARTINRAIKLLRALSAEGFGEGEYFPRQKLTQAQLKWVRAERKYRSIGLEGDGLRTALFNLATSEEPDALDEFLDLSQSQRN